MLWRLKVFRHTHGEPVKENGDLECRLCNRKLGKAKFENHITRHHRLVRCPDCAKFIPFRKMAKHKFDTHSENIPTCGICGYRNISPLKVNRHQRKTHMQERDVACPQCPKKFFSNFDLGRHMVSHDMERRFECSFCQKKFQRKKTLLLHEKIHTGVKNKVCSLCDAKFVQKASLNYHMAKHHPETC